jgi:hypothetical protein
MILNQLQILAAQWADRLLARPFVATAVAEKADLSPFKEKPSPRIIAGLVIIGLSFLLGWPAVAGIGAVAVKLHQPWIVVVGGPLVYGLSHLVFILGMYLCGAKYSMIFLRWLTRKGVEQLQSWGCCPVEE